MFMPVKSMGESLDEIRILSEVKLTIELHVFLDSFLEGPMSKVRVLRFSVLSDWNVGVGVLELD